MAAEVRFPPRDEHIFISKEVFSAANSSLAATQMTANSEDSRSSSPEGLVIRFRVRQQLHSRRTISDRGKGAKSGPSSAHYPGPVLRPKKAKTPCRNKSSAALKPVGVLLGAELPEGPKLVQKRGKIGRFPTMLMLRLVNSHSHNTFSESKASPSLTLITLRGPSEALPVRITNLRPVQRPSFRGRIRPIIEEKGPICHFNTLTMERNFKGNCTLPEKGEIDIEKVISRRKVVFERRENTVEDVDPDYDQVVSSYYL